MAELESLRLRGIPVVERDLWFEPKPLSEAMRIECPNSVWKAP